MMTHKAPTDLYDGRGVVLPTHGPSWPFRLIDCDSEVLWCQALEFITFGGHWYIIDPPGFFPLLCQHKRISFFQKQTQNPWLIHISFWCYFRLVQAMPWISQFLSITDLMSVTYFFAVWLMWPWRMKILNSLSLILLSLNRCVGFVKVVTYICQNCNMYFLQRAKSTKLKID